MLDRLAFTRFLAALMVVCFHLGGGVPMIDQMPWSPVVMAGGVAVSFFFVLSGFIMAMVYGDLEMDGAKGYWRARLARIYPVYLLGLVLSIGRYADPFGWILSIFLIQAWVPGYALSGNLVGWSLSVELFFYALFPALIVLARRMGLVRWLVGVTAFWLITQAWGIFAISFFEGPYPSTAHQFVHYFPPTYLSCFLVGITAGLLVRRGIVLSVPVAGIVALGSFILAAAVVLVELPIVMPKHMGLLAPVLAIGIVALYFLPSRWSSSASARLLGEASYALYILHWPLAPLLQKQIAPSLGLTSLPGFLFSVAVLVGLSVAVYLRIESPARTALRFARPTSLPVSNVR